MAPVSSKLGKDDLLIPDHLTCPVCFNLPEKEVFQCRDGHVLCSKCYLKMKECPQCRLNLDKADPIRNRYFEWELEQFAKVGCSFKSNGCQQKVARCLLEQHSNGCYFNFQRFGRPFKLCRMMNQDCNFRFNAGKTEEAVDHFVSAHGAKLTKGKEFRVQLCKFEEGIDKADSAVSNHEDDNRQVFTPFIANLEEKDCYVITIPVRKTAKDSLEIMSYFLPYSSALVGKWPLPKPSFEMKYSVVSSSTTKACQGTFLKLVLTQVPLTLMEAEADQHFGNFQGCQLKPFITKENDLLIDCKILTGKPQPKKILVKESFKCLKIPSILKRTGEQSSKIKKRWNPQGASSAAREFLESLLPLISSEKVGEGKKALRIIDMVLESALEIDGGRLSARFGKEDFEFILNCLLMYVAGFGSVKALKRMLWLPGFDWAVLNSKGVTALHLTMKDLNLERGLEKAELLVGKIDYKALDDNKWSLLHYAVWWSTGKSVEFACQLGLDVNGEDTEGNTPLHLVAGCPFQLGLVKVEKMEVLLNHGANLKAKNKQGITPLDIIKRDGDWRVRSFAQSLID